MKPPFEIDENNIKEMVDHMPQYIIRAPFYATGGLEEITTLKHQKLTDEERNRWTPITSHVERGFYHNNVYKYRKGACENCGAITHKTKECFERPRKRGARWTKNNFGNDEFIKPLMYKNDYEGKRDRWNGYDNSKELEKFKEYEIIEKQIELNESENNKDKKKLEEEVKEEDNQKKLKFEQMQKLISEKSKQEKEMKNNDEILLDIKQKDYLEMVKDKKLRDLLERYGGAKYLYVPESIKTTNNLRGFPNEEEEEIEEDDEEKKLRKQEERARIFMTMNMDKKNQVRLERKRIKLLALKTKRAAAGLIKICENGNN